MQQTISSVSLENIIASPLYSEKSVKAKSIKANSVEKFIRWCGQQEKNRLLWLGIAIMGHIGMVLPLTLLAILFFAGNNFVLWIVVLCANTPVLALNLAAQPPKVTIPALFTSLVVDAAIIILAIVTFIL